MIAPRPQLSLSFGSDRSLVWEEGESVRYLVADISATGTVLQDAKHVPVNLALVVDVSGSMAGDKIAAARDTATAVVDALTAEDRLTLVAFDETAELLLDARRMDAAGRRAALAAIRRLVERGSTNLEAGWSLAAERLAAAASPQDRAAQRLMLLTDGHANVGLSDAPSLARLSAEGASHGIITSAVGIGDGYAEELLAAMTEAGSGRLHDATDGKEIHEVVIGELTEGRLSLVDRIVLTVSLPTHVERAEVVGSWHAKQDGRTLTVTVGSLRADQRKSVVIRVFCHSGLIGRTMDFAASLSAQLPDGSAELAVDAPVVTLTYADGVTNSAQPRDIIRTLTAFSAWQSAAMRQALRLNGHGAWDEARAFLRRERMLLRRYAHDVPGTEVLLKEVDLLYHQVGRHMEERSRKELFVGYAKRGRVERDFRERPGVDMEYWLRRNQRPRQ